MSLDLLTLSYPLAFKTYQSSKSQEPKKLGLRIKRPASEDVDTLHERSFTQSDIGHKRIRLTTDEQKMVGVQIQAARDHDCSQSKLPVFEPIRVGAPLYTAATECSLQGKRLVNEDRHIIAKTKYGDIFAVCDGHGLIDQKRLKEKKPQEGQEIANMVAESIKTDLPNFIENKFFNTKLAFEKWCTHIQSKLPHIIAGTTVAIGFYELITQLLHVATVGDTEVVVFRKKEGNIYPIPMSPRMSWDNPEAIARIQKILSADEFAKWMSNAPKNRRFPPDKGVNMAWSLGDKLMIHNNQTAINHLPKCSLLQLQKGDIVLIGCDGIFDVTNVHELIETILAPHWDNQSIDLAYFIASYALKVKNSTDNVTAMVIRVGQKPEEEDLPTTQSTEEPNTPPVEIVN